jgi:hypothetical protein
LNDAELDDILNTVSDPFDQREDDVVLDLPRIKRGINTLLEKDDDDENIINDIEVSNQMVHLANKKKLLLE